MNNIKEMLSRFIEMQEFFYDTALSEIKNGKKRSHWMWFIFPQIKGLGKSPMSEKYAIENIDEARLYLSHPVLGKRLCEITDALIALDETDPEKVMGEIDAIKLMSCMTLFANVGETDMPFSKVLDKFYDGKQDELTLNILCGM